MCLYFDRAVTHEQRIRQPKGYLGKAGNRIKSHVFCRHVVALVVTVDQIDYDSRFRFPRVQKL